MTTSLELGCDCLGEIRYLDAVLHDSAGEPQTITQRDLHPRGGQRRPLEARRRAGRRRGAPHAQARRVLPRHGGQLRVPRLLALLPGRQHRVRGARHRDHGHHAVRGRRRAALRHGRRHADLRADPPALHRRAPRHGGRRPGQHRRHVRDRAAARSARTTRTASRSTQRSVPLRTEAEGEQDFDWSTQRAWKVTNPNVRNKVGTPVAYKLVPGAARAADARPELAGAAPRPGARRTRCGSPRTPREERWPCGEFVNQSADRRGPAGVDGGRPLDRQHRRRALVHVRHPPRPARRGLADHAGRHRVVLAQAHRVLRPQPVAGRRTVPLSRGEQA